MITDWQEFTGGEHKDRYRTLRVTMKPSGEIYFGKLAFEALSSPDAVKLFFDIGGSRIGIKPVAAGEKTFEVVRRSHTPYGYIRARTFCKHYGINPEARIEFQNVEIDADGFMVLDLTTARRQRR